MIIPQSTQLTIPFQAVYLRGVVVRVIKIFEQNIGQFLQVNDLEGTSDLMRVGRLIARKTIFLDEDATQDLSRWNTYAIDLKELIDPEPGAIYRVELSFNRDLSAYPCEDLVKKSKEQLLADDEIKFKEESSRFDEAVITTITATSTGPTTIKANVATPVPTAIIIIRPSARMSSPPISVCWRWPAKITI